jgi:hypothetical protein
MKSWIVKDHLMINLVLDTTRKKHTMKLALLRSMMQVLHCQKVKEKLQVKNLHKERKLSEEQSKEDTKKPPLHLKKFRKETPSRWTPKQRYENVFHGHCFSCNEYGHKALDCRHYARKDVGRFHNT